MLKISNSEKIMSGVAKLVLNDEGANTALYASQILQVEVIYIEDSIWEVDGTLHSDDDLHDLICNSTPENAVDYISQNTDYTILRESGEWCTDIPILE